MIGAADLIFLLLLIATIDDAGCPKTDETGKTASFYGALPERPTKIFSIIAQD